MQLKPLDFDFPLMSDISTRPPFDVEHDELAAELEAELADRRAFYGRQVAKGKMLQADADRHIDLLAAIRDDLSFARADGRWLGARHGWDAKVRELRRELAIRRSYWPRRIAAPADPLDQATAARRMECLEAVHFKYWIELFGFDTEVADQPRDRGRTRIRAELWLRWRWQRAQLASPATARLVPRGFAEWLARVDADDPEACRVWHEFEAEARSLGLAPKEEIAA